MLYIMRNYQTEPGKYHYNLYDSDEQTQSSMHVTPKEAELLKKQFNMQNICPLDTMSMFDYKKVSLGMFLPLPL